MPVLTGIYQKGNRSFDAICIRSRSSQPNKLDSRSWAGEGLAPASKHRRNCRIDIAFQTRIRHPHAEWPTLALYAPPMPSQGVKQWTDAVSRPSNTTHVQQEIEVDDKSLIIRAMQSCRLMCSNTRAIRSSGSPGLGNDTAHIMVLGICDISMDVCIPLQRKNEMQKEAMIARKPRYSKNTRRKYEQRGLY